MSENNPSDYLFDAMAEVLADADEASTSQKNAAVKEKKEKDINLPRDADGKLNAGAKYKDADKEKLTKDLCAQHNDTIEEMQIEGTTSSLNTPAKDFQSVETGKEFCDLSKIKQIKKHPRQKSCVQTPKKKAASLNRIRELLASKRAARARKPAPVALPTDKPSCSKYVFAPPQNQSAKADLSGAVSSSNLTAPESTDDVVTIGHNGNNREVDLKDEKNKTIVVISPNHEADTQDSDKDNLTTAKRICDKSPIKLATQPRQEEHKQKWYACMSTSKIQKNTKKTKKNKKIKPLNKRNLDIESPSTQGAGPPHPPYVLKKLVVKLKRCSANYRVVSLVVPPDDKANIAEDPTERNVTK